MDKRDPFDDNLKSVVNIKNYNIEPSKNIFEEAWCKKDIYTVDNKFSIIKPVRKIAIATVFSFILLFSSILVISPKARTFALETYNNIRTIFVMETSGDESKIVEKSEDVPIKCENIGSRPVTEANKVKLEEKLGFSFFFPKTLEKNFKLESEPFAMVTVYDIKLADLEELRGEFLKLIDGTSTSKKINNYKTSFSVGATYSDGKDNKYNIYSSKSQNDSIYDDTTKVTVINEIDIENIQCKLVEILRPLYPTEVNGTWFYEDVTQKPRDVIKTNYITWQYNDISYSVTNSNPNKVLDIDNATSFLKDYIKYLKLTK